MCFRLATLLKCFIYKKSRCIRKKIVSTDLRDKNSDSSSEWKG